MLSQFQPGICDRLLAPESDWFLSAMRGNGWRREVPVASLPFRIGRWPELEFCIPDPTVSKVHAQIIAVESQLFVRDLNSTNGTCVNGYRIQQDCPLAEGDVLRFANSEFHLGRKHADRREPQIPAPKVEQLGTALQISRLITEKRVIPFFQPIVAIADLSPLGYEVLARTRTAGLENPRELFAAAGEVHRAAELSMVCREVGIAASESLPGSPNIFLNTHPEEKLLEGVLESLQALRAFHPQRMMTLEVHEAAVTDAGQMNEFRAALRELNIQLAYDDFGSGQNRLLDLAKAPPDFLKFDMSLIRGIQAAPPKQRQMVGLLVQMAKDFGTATLAEGIECPEEADVCRLLGFDFAQGYYFGKPASADAVLWYEPPSAWSDSTLAPPPE